MDKLKRFVDILLPITACNLRCPYCFITQKHLFANHSTVFPCDALRIGQALSKDRLGGICHINIGGSGETLIPSETVAIVEEILKQGHYVFVVTNGLISERIDEFVKFPQEFRERLGVKFSFHYMELLRTNQMDIFFRNIDKVRRAGCSFTLELTPHDELIPHIDDIMAICREKVGALCHITVARDERQSHFPLLTNYSVSEYKKYWGVFDSKFFDFKMSTWEVKRKEFCYAGDWTAMLNLADGSLRPCYDFAPRQNILKVISEPINFSAIGCNCQPAHCFNAHSLLGLGAIPSLDSPTYAEMRNRVCEDGSEWLAPRFKSFISQKIGDNTEELSTNEKRRINKNVRKQVLCSRPYFWYRTGLGKAKAVAKKIGIKPRRRR